MHVWKEDQKDPAPPNAIEKERAWEIHKDADANLHGRVNAFVTTQAFLFAGFAALLGLNVAEPSRHWLIPIVFLIGVASSVVFAFSQARILTGIEFLKNEYLLKHDDVYKAYYWAKERAFDSEFVPRLPIKYRVARGTPWVFLATWLIVFLFANGDVVEAWLGFAPTT